MEHIVFGYCRVSTATQVHSLYAQEQAIRLFCEREGLTLAGVATEVASGGNTERPILNALVNQAKVSGSPIIVMKLDRLSRDVHHIAGLMKDGTPFITCEFGKDVDPFMLHIWASLAEQQRRYIADRTRVGLASARAKGVRLGNPRWKDSLGAARSQSTAKADDFAAQLAPVIKEIQEAGILSYTGIAKALNSRGVKTRTGKSWYPATVRNIINRQGGTHAAR